MQGFFKENGFDLGCFLDLLIFKAVLFFLNRTSETLFCLVSPQALTDAPAAVS